MFDILITVAEKDYNKLPFVLDSIYKNVKGFDEIYVVSPSAVPDEYMSDAHYLIDNEVIGFDLSRIEENRRGWYRQQFIKLFQNVTKDDYLVVDADIWINKRIVIDPETPTFYLGRNQEHRPYFQVMETLFGFGKVYPHSFICEMMFFKRTLVREMLKQAKHTRKAFVEACVEEVVRNGHPSGFSEYETYGNFVTKCFPGIYSYQPITVHHYARKREWTYRELCDYVNALKGNTYDVITMHSWI